LLLSRKCSVIILWLKNIKCNGNAKMPIITLPDGSHKKFNHNITVAELVSAIDASLAKGTLAGKVNGKLVDTTYKITENISFEAITANSDDALEIIRHSTAHVLAQAVKALFPTAQVSIGPVIENGFYYDFSFHRPFTPEDLFHIEKKMKEIIKSDLKFEKKVINREEALRLFNKMGEFYKVQIINAIPTNELLTIYKQGNFFDLCRGPHIPRTSFLKAFKLTSVAGAYWCGDSKNEMLQRIYGTAWSDKKALDSYLKRKEEAERRDHRLLAKKMELFHFQPEASGSVFWHPRGWQLIQTILKYLRDFQTKTGYQEISTPVILDIDLWKKSGHKEKFAEEMFVFNTEDKREYAIKPMSCPCHIQIFKHRITSYRDLPLRLAEFGCCHRNEPSGSLHGLMRLREFEQDDGHIFCSKEQIHSEVLAFIEQLHQVYRDFGFHDIIHKLSTRPERRVGSDEVWDCAEKALADALNSTTIPWEELPGEGAFYGPKIEFSLKDCLGRIWQCGTIQVDFSMPNRLGAEYVSNDGSKQNPVMLHRAILGSVERFVGILLEEYAGYLPLWLAPIQVVVIGISERHHSYVTEITEALKFEKIRVVSDLRNEKIGFKIREHTISRIPYVIVLGDQELEQQQVTLRSTSEKKSLSMHIDVLIEFLSKEIIKKKKQEILLKDPIVN
jgi:threonyl-tRNA synthetase